MEMLWNVRKDEDYTIHLTYPIEEIDQERQKDWISQQNKEGATSDWSPGKQSLKAFFDEHKTFFNEQKLKIVKEGEPHVIDLLEDKVGF